MTYELPGGGILPSYAVDNKGGDESDKGYPTSPRREELEKLRSLRLPCLSFSPAPTRYRPLPPSWWARYGHLGASRAPWLRVSGLVIRAANE